MKCKNRGMRRLGIESLERREMMAGNVWASVQQGLLKVTGDDQANSVAVYQDSSCRAGQFIVAPQSGTLVNGGMAKLKFSNATRGIQAIMNGGNDTLWVGQQGTIVTSVAGSFGLGIDMGSGNDNLHVWKVNVAGSCGISGQAGDDQIYVDGRSYFAWDLIIDTADGNDQVSVHDSTAAHYLMVGTGAGNDTAALDSSGAAWIYVNMGNGDDYLSAACANPALPPGFDGGSGANDRLWHYNNIFPAPYPVYAPPYCINWESIS